MDKLRDKARVVVLLPGDAEIYARRTAEDDTVEIVVATEAGELRPVRCELRPAVVSTAAKAA